MAWDARELLPTQADQGEPNLHTSSSARPLVAYDPGSSSLRRAKENVEQSFAYKAELECPAGASAPASPSTTWELIVLRGAIKPSKCSSIVRALGRLTPADWALIHRVLEDRLDQTPAEDILDDYLVLTTDYPGGRLFIHAHPSTSFTPPPGLDDMHGGLVAHLILDTGSGNRTISARPLTQSNKPTPTPADADTLLGLGDMIIYPMGKTRGVVEKRKIWKDGRGVQVLTMWGAADGGGGKVGDEGGGRGG